MGCGVCKRHFNTAVDLKLMESGDPHLDAVFKELQEPLSLLTTSRKQLKAALKSFQKEVGVYKQLVNPTFFDFLMAMLFCLSASGEGDLEAIGFTYSREAPFITVNEDLLCVEHRGIMLAWKALVHLAVQIQETLKPLRVPIQAAIVRTARSGQPDNPMESDPVTATESQASPLIARTLSANHSKLSQAPEVLNAVVEQAREVTDTVLRLPSILSEASVAIKAVGQQAYVDLRLSPRDIVTKYWPSTKTCP